MNKKNGTRSFYSSVLILKALYFSVLLQKELSVHSLLIVEEIYDVTFTGCKILHDERLVKCIKQLQTLKCRRSS